MLQSKLSLSCLFLYLTISYIRNPFVIQTFTSQLLLEFLHIIIVFLFASCLLNLFGAYYIGMEYENKIKQVHKPKYDCLLFDIDDTIYPLSSGLSTRCTKNIQEYMFQKLGIEEGKVAELCLSLYKEYGTTMAGLRAIGYNFDYDEFHSFVHGRLPYDMLIPDPVLRNLLHSLPIRKVLFTNGDKQHAARVLARLGLEDCFERVICFETLNPTDNGNVPVALNCQPREDVELRKTPILCKPNKEAFEQAYKIAKINPGRTLFFDDSVRNIQAGKRTGLHTVLVGSSNRVEGADYALETLHNIKEAFPELWIAAKKAETVAYSGEIGIETPVRA